MGFICLLCILNILLSLSTPINRAFLSHDCVNTLLYFTIVLCPSFAIFIRIWIRVFLTLFSLLYRWVLVTAHEGRFTHLWRLESSQAGRISFFVSGDHFWEHLIDDIIRCVAQSLLDVHLALGGRLGHVSCLLARLIHIRPASLFNFVGIFLTCLCCICRSIQN